MKTYADNLVRNYGDGGFDNGDYLKKRIMAKVFDGLYTSVEDLKIGIDKLVRYKHIDRKTGDEWLKVWKNYWV